MKIKICGLFRDCDIDYVNEAKPDYIGFVFAESRRRISFETAKHMKKQLSPEIKSVGVFVDEYPEVIADALDSGIIDIVQLHGHEDGVYIDNISAPVIKAVRIGEPIPENADFLLFDSSVAGSGQSFDWTKLPHTDKPFFIAGGISLDNIGKAVQLDCYGVDISSGSEAGGVKDREKILELVRRVRNV